MTTITLKTKLPDSNDDKVVDVSADGAKRYGLPKKGKWYGPLPGQPDYTYSDVKPGAEPAPAPPPPVVTPPAPPPPPPATTGLGALSAGEAFVQNDVLSVGFNAFGGIGTTKAAPKGFRSDTRTGLLRVGLFAGTMLANNSPKPVGQIDDVILQGRAIEGFMLFVNGKRYANMLLNAFGDIAGKFTDPLRWAGAVAGVDVVQDVQIAGNVVRLSVTETNRTGSLIETQYVRVIDPDQSSDDAGGPKNFSSDNWVSLPGVMECGLFGGGKLVIRAVGATFSTQDSVGKAAVIGTPRPLGASKNADEVVQAVWPAARLAAGQSITHVIEYEVVAP